MTKKVTASYILDTLEVALQYFGAQMSDYDEYMPLDHIKTSLRQMSAKELAKVLRQIHISRRKSLPRGHCVGLAEQLLIGTVDIFSDKGKKVQKLSGIKL